QTTGYLSFNLNYGTRGLRADLNGNYVAWLRHDHEGSHIASTALPNRPTSYDPFGNPEDGIGRSYRGELQHQDRIHLRNRDYDPTTATFLTKDPLDGVDGTPTVANAYHYVDNDPLNRQDQLGLRPSDDGDFELPSRLDRMKEQLTNALENYLGALMDPGVWEYCGSGGFDGFISVTLNGCAVDDGDKFAFIGGSGGGVGGYAVAASLGATYSNARSISELEGHSYCFAVNVWVLDGVACAGILPGFIPPDDVLLSLDNFSDEHLNEVFTFYGGLGYSAGGSASVQLVDTELGWTKDYPRFVPRVLPKPTDLVGALTPGPAP
ncbi:MAG: hypothetical protein GY788_11680, partial [bacterium]|nr:hypothetical protein [bacterium]